MSATPVPSSLNAITPARTISPISASSLPCRPTVSAPIGYTRVDAARAACRNTNSIAASLSSGGSVFGMQATAVNPPAAAAAVPVSIVSHSSKPGSRR